MDYADNATQLNAAYLGGGHAKAPSPHRTLDAIAGAVSDLRDLNNRLDTALNRLGHERCEPDAPETTGAALQVVGPDYSRSLRHLDAQISMLRANITALETHV